MPTYTLNIQIDKDAVTMIHKAKQFVTLVKSMTSSNLPVAWVTFSPQESNTVTWTEDYSVYASTTNIEAGAQIVTMSTQPAHGGYTYTVADGVFDDGTPNLPPTEYGVADDDPTLKIDGFPMITAGLYQSAVVNGATKDSPLNAVTVLYNSEAAKFTPIEKVQVFLSSYSDNGLVISSVSSDALTVDLTSVPTQIIHFVDSTNEFAKGPLPALESV